MIQTYIRRKMFLRGWTHWMPLGPTFKTEGDARGYHASTMRDYGMWVQWWFAKEPAMWQCDSCGRSDNKPEDKRCKGCKQRG